MREEFAQGWKSGVADQRRDDWDVSGRFRSGSWAYREGYLRGHLAAYLGEQTLTSEPAWAETA